MKWNMQLFGCRGGWRVVFLVALANVQSDGYFEAIDSGHGLGKKTEGFCMIKPSGALTT